MRVERLAARWVRLCELVSAHPPWRRYMASISAPGVGRCLGVSEDRFERLHTLYLHLQRNPHLADQPDMMNFKRVRVGWGRAGLGATRAGQGRVGCYPGGAGQGWVLPGWGLLNALRCAVLYCMIKGTSRHVVVTQVGVRLCTILHDKGDK